MIWNTSRKNLIRTARRKNNPEKQEAKEHLGHLQTSNIRIMGMPDGEEKEQETENLFEKIMKGNLPNLVKEIDIQVQETQRIPNKIDPKRTTPRHIIIKMPKVKDKES